MSKCEVCQQPATHVCSGLDVPELRFCKRHGAEHAKHCTYVHNGNACLVEIPT